jgi:hypothetical protein
MGLEEKITENKQIIGLDCLLCVDGTTVYSAVWLKKTSSKIISEEAFEKIDSLAVFSNSLKEKPPAVLILNGKGIIHKHVSWNETDDGKTLLHKAVPNASAAEFYLQQSIPFNGKVLVSIARRSFVDLALDQCLSNKLDVIGCSFGPCVLESVLPLLDIGKGYQYDFPFSEYSLSVVDNHLENFKIGQPFQEGQVKIGDDEISFGTLIPFAAAFSTLAGLAVPKTDIERIQSQKEENKQKHLFQFTLYGFVGFLLILMLVNFFVFGHFKTKKQHLEQTLALNRDILPKQDTLTKEYHRKQDFLERTGMLQASRASYYADDLGRNLPLSISLSGMNINPFQKPKADEDKITFQNKTIRVSGFCNQSLELNDWMQEVKKKTWVKNLVLLNYYQGKGMTSGEFFLQMDIK